MAGRPGILLRLGPRQRPRRGVRSRDAPSCRSRGSGCATPEDHAAGNYWSDEHDNPEHRIDKIGVLVGTRPA